MLDIEIDRRPFLTRLNAIEEGRIRKHREYAEYDEPGRGPRRRPLYKPGEGFGAEPASNRSASTLLVHAATACAKEQGLDGLLFRAASKEYWEQGVDLGSLYTLRRVSVSVGLDWGDLWPKLESGSYHDLVLRQHEEATEAGVVRAPSFRIDGALHSGNMSFEELRAAVQAAK